MRNRRAARLRKIGGHRPPLQQRSRHLFSEESIISIAGRRTINHEFTPQGQENLDKWADMITINVYQSAHDGDALATKANAVLENYKSHNGRVLRTDSVPRTPDRPAEHFIAVVFGRPNFIEVAFARFKLVNGVGCSIVYSHRIYGEKVGDQMSAWLNDNGPKTEKMLMEWNNIPSPTSLRELARTESRPGETKSSSSKSQ